MEINFLGFSISILLCYIIYFIIIKSNIFLNQLKEKHQNFVDRKFILPIGGYFILMTIFVMNIKFISLEILFFIPIFIIGALSDIKKFNSPQFRFIVQTIIIIFFVYFANLKLTSTRIDILDVMLENTVFRFSFITFCILIVLNGTNFIDGLNGLVLSYYSLITIFLIYADFELSFLNNPNFLQELLILLIVILIFNILNKLYIGDSGSYLLGFIYSVLLLNIYHENNYISPYFIILLLWYPCFENLFSIIRKYRFKKSPINPDTKHLHQLIFYFINKKSNSSNFLINNLLSSFVIIFYNILIFYIGFIYITKTNIQILLLTFNVFIYFLIYIKLFNFRFRKI
tara:strand:- start:361 stop:1389 length:1029 start_codon:yes stop_codon:yes gene_type:complete